MRRFPGRHRDRVEERALGIHTTQRRPRAPIDMFAERTVYDTLSYSALSVLDAAVPVQADDCVCDIGCGKGRIICHFARKPVREVVGIEYDPGLATQARANVERLKGRVAPATVLCGDAAEQDLSSISYAFLFNPFGAATLETVVRNLLAGDALRVIVYANPVHEVVFDAFPTLARTMIFSVPYDVTTMPVHVYTR